MSVIHVDFKKKIILKEDHPKKENKDNAIDTSPALEFPDCYAF